MAGGIDGPSPLPSIASCAPYPNSSGNIARPGVRVPGGQQGTRSYFTPNVDKSAPYFVGMADGHMLRRGLQFFRRFVPNTAGRDAFLPLRDGRVAWTPNNASGPGPVLAPIPISNKFINRGIMRRQFGVDDQLFTQLPPWIIQKPWQAKRTMAQPQQSPPSQPKLTRWQPAAAYGQTTQQLVPALTNLLRSASLPTADPNGPTYGSY